MSRNNRSPSAADDVERERDEAVEWQCLRRVADLTAVMIDASHTGRRRSGSSSGGLDRKSRIALKSSIIPSWITSSRSAPTRWCAPCSTYQPPVPAKRSPQAHSSPSWADRTRLSSLPRSTPGTGESTRATGLMRPNPPHLAFPLSASITAWSAPPACRRQAITQDLPYSRDSPQVNAPRTDGSRQRARPWRTGLTSARAIYGSPVPISTNAHGCRRQHGPRGSALPRM